MKRLFAALVIFVTVLTASITSKIILSNKINRLCDMLIESREKTESEYLNDLKNEFDDFTIFAGVFIELNALNDAEELMCTMEQSLKNGKTDEYIASSIGLENELNGIKLREELHIQNIF